MLLLSVLFLGVVYGTFTATGSERIDMNGEIIGLCSDDLQGNSKAIDSVLVEGYQTGVSYPQNISVSIGENTIIYHKYGKNLVKASTDDIKAGQKIEIRFDGPVLQTYPPQTNASAIIILY